VSLAFIVKIGFLDKMSLHDAKEKMNQSDMMSSPDIVIAGAPKCGTTSLFKWLSTHPGICPSSVKETYYLIDKEYPLYNPEANWNVHGIAGYARYYSHCRGHGQLRLEATPDYLYQATARNAISELENKPHLIFILRKPSERVYSFFKFAQHNRSVIDSKMHFSDAVHEMGKPGGIFEKKNPLLHFAINHSLYYQHLKLWSDMIPSERIHVMLFEDMVRNPKAFMVDLSTKLKINPDYYDSFAFSIHNSGYTVRFQHMHRWKRAIKSIFPQWVNIKWLKYVYQSMNLSKRSIIKSTRDAEALAWLNQYFYDENVKLARKYGLDLTSWGINSNG
jgi:hypothetical protein